MRKPGAIYLLGVPVHRVTMAGTVDLVCGYMAGSRVHQIATVNPEFVMKAQEDAHFKKVLQRADLCIPDGVGLLYAARRYGQRLPERVPGSELVYHLAEAAAAYGWRLFLLGAQPGVAGEAAKKLCQRYPGLQIAGTYAGSPDPAEDEAIVARINASRAGLLYVAYGAPRQDKWIARTGIGWRRSCGYRGRRRPGLHRRKGCARPGLAAAAEPGMALPTGARALALAPDAGAPALRLAHPVDALFAGCRGEATMSGRPQQPPRRGCRRWLLAALFLLFTACQVARLY